MIQEIVEKAITQGIEKWKKQDQSNCVTKGGDQDMQIDIQRTGEPEKPIEELNTIEETKEIIKAGQEREKETQETLKLLKDIVLKS